MSMLQRYVPDSFPLPHEVFELGLCSGPLLVYIALVYCKSLRHGMDALSCVSVSKLVGLCEKSVRTHLRALESEGLIQVANSGSKFTCTLCPIRDMVEKQHAAITDQTRKISWRSTQQKWLTGEMFKAVFPLPNDVFRIRSHCRMRCSSWASVTVLCWCTSRWCISKVCGTVRTL